MALIRILNVTYEIQWYLILVHASAVLGTNMLGTDLVNILIPVVSKSVCVCVKSAKPAVASAEQKGDGLWQRPGVSRGQTVAEARGQQRLPAWCRGLSRDHLSLEASLSQICPSHKPAPRTR